MFIVRAIEDDEFMSIHTDFDRARKEADKFCEDFKCQRHFRVIKQEDAYVTSTLDEAINNK